MDIVIVGGGINGLTLALSLHELGIPCRIYESAPVFKRLGVGINLQPYCVCELANLGLLPTLRSHAVEPCEMNYYNRFGQLVFSEPRGKSAGYEWPQLSLHRGDLHQVLLDAVQERLGPGAVIMNHQCIGVEQDEAGVTVRFVDSTGRPQGSVSGVATIGCDGFHSVIRRQLCPDEGPPSYQGINMWRGVTRWNPFLTGRSAAQAGWLEVGKILMFPLMRDLDENGLQLINWVAEIQSSRNVMLDWNREGDLADFLPTFTDWHFPWLDVTGMIRKHHILLECPMVDRDPLQQWTSGRVTLLGDAAHPMYPRGGNGAGQGILDTRVLARCLKFEPDVKSALKAYEAERLPAANSVVLRVRHAPPDLMLKIVHERSGDRPFKNIDDLISEQERIKIIDDYKRVAGYGKITGANATAQ